MCISYSYARNSAVVNAILGVITRSIAGSSARLRKATIRSIAPVRSKSCMKNEASSWVMPIAANTTENGSPEANTFACLAICAARALCGIPAPENIGNFCPRTSVFIPSIVEMPV